MLRNRYQEILVGMGLPSLVRGLISLKRNRTALLIDDERFLSDSYHLQFLSEMEISALIRIGKTYDIPELVNLRGFLIPGKVEFVIGDRRLRLGSSSFESLRELLRKFPELIDPSDLDQVYAEGAQKIDRLLLEEMQRYERLAFESSARPKAFRFELQGPRWLKSIYANFATLMNQEYAQAGDLSFAGLLHLLSISAEDKLKTTLPPEEAPFLFFRLLSPLYRLQDFYLTTQLKRRLLVLGGDVKQSRIQYWQLDGRKFTNLLLASFEGVISGDRVLFFGHLPEDVPFTVRSPYPVFRKNQLRPSKKISSAFPPSELKFITRKDCLGSDSPYRILAQDQSVVFYHWPYPDMPGSKPEFYHQGTIQSFHDDAQDLPFKLVPVEANVCPGATLDLRELKESRKNELPVLTRLPLEIVEDQIGVIGFEYWGPFRYKGLGLLALCYGVEGI